MDDYAIMRVCYTCGVSKSVMGNYAKNKGGDWYTSCQDCRPLDTRRRDEILESCYEYKKDCMRYRVRCAQMDDTIKQLHKELEDYKYLKTQYDTLQRHSNVLCDLVTSGQANNLVYTPMNVSDR